MVAERNMDDHQCVFYFKCLQILFTFNLGNRNYAVKIQAKVRVYLVVMYRFYGVALLLRFQNAILVQ